MKLPLIAAVAACLALVPACSLFTSKGVNTILDIAQITCAIVNAESGDATVAQVCGVADALIPDLQKLLAAQRREVAKARRLTSCADAGATEAGAR